MRRFLMILVLGMTSSAAMAQFNPFQTEPGGPKLTGTDLDIMLSSVNHLNRSETVAVGSSESWDNPTTGSFGKSTVTRLTEKQGMKCHVIGHDFSVGKPQVASRFQVSFTWCLTPDRGWKIAE